MDREELKLVAAMAGLETYGTMKSAIMDYFVAHPIEDDATDDEVEKYLADFAAVVFTTGYTAGVLEAAEATELL